MPKLAVCVCVLLVLLVPHTESGPVKTCCTHYQEKPIPIKWLIDYTLQDFAQHCNIMAIIFRTVKNRCVCGNPDSDWVKHAMEFVPEVY
ncbi:C-C motif chemokine 20 [Channa argus]|uniref:C-C motif chemokine 20 n=1 Tax=Channa argus TaxID=215402 RepID=A0A6G1Q9H2_CHAAH|nr:C-C motif chemokine 20 [Channa argus]